MIIGLTGGIGCGKSTVAKLFRELNIQVVDSDQITRELVAPGQPALQAIVNYFGETILAPDKTLDRSKLRSLIFESNDHRRWLEHLLHPLAKEEILRLREKIISGQFSDQQTGKYMIVEIPLLIESHFEHAVDRILVVDCRPEQQIERIAARDNLPTHAIQAILDAQTTRNTRLEKAHDVILNDAKIDDLREKVLNLHQHYVKLIN